MQISMSDLKLNPAKYFDLASTVEVVVTLRGKPVGKIVRIDGTKDTAAEKKAAFDNLFSIAAKLPPNIDADAARMERLSR